MLYKFFRSTLAVLSFFVLVSGSAVSSGLDVQASTTSKPSVEASQNKSVQPKSADKPAKTFDVVPGQLSVLFKTATRAKRVSGQAEVRSLANDQRQVSVLNVRQNRSDASLKSMQKPGSPTNTKLENVRNLFSRTVELKFNPATVSQSTLKANAGQSQVNWQEKRDSLQRNLELYRREFPKATERITTIQSEVDRLDKLSKLKNTSWEEQVDPGTRALKASLEKNPDIQEVRYIFRRKSRDIPNDTYFSRQWGFQNNAQSYPTEGGATQTGTTGADMKIASGWDSDTSNRGNGITIGLTDSGIDYTHPELVDNLWINQGEIPGAFRAALNKPAPAEITSQDIITYCAVNCKNLTDQKTSQPIPKNLLSVFSTQNGLPLLMDGQDGDGNGYVDDLIGWNFDLNTNDVLDLDGHGTHVAGTMAAAANNTQGVAGVASKAKIVTAQIPFASQSELGFAESIIYAAANSKAFNMSWGGVQPDLNPSTDLVYQALDVATTVYNSTPVAAAGNDRLDSSIPGAIFTPNAFDNVISVAASNSRDKLANFSNFGPDLEVAAPGEDILSLNALEGNNSIALNCKTCVLPGDNRYLTISGTSMAAPHITGAAALIIANGPKDANNQPLYGFSDVLQVIRNNNDQLGSGDFNDTYGYGRANLAKYLGAGHLAQQYPTVQLNLQNYQELKLAKYPIRGQVSGPNATNWTLEYRQLEQTNWTNLASGSPTTGVLVPSFDTTSLAKGAYYFRLSSGTAPYRSVDIKKVVVGNIQNSFTVNTTSDQADSNPGNGICDTGEVTEFGEPNCTFRAALQEANVATNVTNFREPKISFVIPTSDPKCTFYNCDISPSVPLPAISNTMQIDFNTVQISYPEIPVPMGGSSSNDISPSPSQPRVSIRGNLQASGPGLEISSGKVKLTGAYLTDFPGDGIKIQAGSDVQLSDSELLNNGQNGVLATNPKLLQIFGSIFGSNAGNGLTVVGGGDNVVVIDSKFAYNTGGITVTDNNSTSAQNGFTVLGGKVNDNKTDGIKIQNSSWLNIIGTEILFHAAGKAIVATGNTDHARFAPYDMSDNKSPFIDLNGDGPTLNAPGVRTGPNKLHNQPVIESAQLTAKGLLITGWSRPGDTLNIYTHSQYSLESDFNTHLTPLVQIIEGGDIDTDSTVGDYSLPGIGSDTGAARFNIMAESGMFVSSPSSQGTGRTPVKVVALGTGVDNSTSELSQAQTLLIDSCFPNSTSSLSFSTWNSDKVGETRLASVMTEFNSKLYQSHVGLDQRIYTRSSSRTDIQNSTSNLDWTAWTSSGDPLEQTKLPISLTSSNGKLYQVHVGLNQRIYTRSSIDGILWTAWKGSSDSFEATSYPVSMVAQSGTLYQVHVGFDHRIYSRYSEDRETWTAWTKGEDPAEFTNYPVSLASVEDSFGGTIYQVHVGLDNKIYSRSSYGKEYYSTWSRGVDPTEFTDSPVAIAGFNKRLFQSHRGGDNTIYTRCSINGLSWGTWQKQAGETRLQPTLTTYNQGLLQSHVGLDTKIYLRRLVE